MTDEEKKDRWEPIAAGPLYCSPACGRGCTRAEYDAAVAGADALVERLGEGWAPRVWENLGWHYSAKSVDGIVEVLPPVFRGTQYSASFKRQEMPANRGRNMLVGSWVAQGETPERAISAVIALAKREIVTIQDSLASFNGAMGDKRFAPTLDNRRVPTVRIVKCDSETAWYSDHVGDEFEVVEWGAGYVLAEDFNRGYGDIWRHLLIDDCEVVEGTEGEL